MKLTGNRPVALGGIAALVLVGAMATKGPSQSSLLQRTAPREIPWLAKGTEAPALRLARADADSVRPEDLRGGETVLVFVTPECPYCRELKTQLLARELPDLNGRLVFVTGSVADSAAPAEIVELEARIAAVYPVAVDTSGATFEAYRAQTVPTTYLIDMEGRVAASAGGVEGGLALIERFVENRSRAQLAALEADR